MLEKETPPETAPLTLANRFSERILDFIGQIPPTEEPEDPTPAHRAARIAATAASRAGATAATLALPPGPLGWLTIIPEILAVWRIQAQMVADIAAVFGKTPHLGREQMVYCLFRHMAAQAVRGLAIRTGEKVLFRRVSLRAFQGMAEKIGVRMTQRAISKGISRWVPVVGAVGVGAYAYYDTRQVAATTIALFEKTIEILPDTDTGELPPPLP